MIGFGFDIHRLQEGESLILGGVDIPHNKGTVAHSDGDVLYHALCDAILGASGLGDIGEHFPDTSSEFKGISSSKLVEKVVEMISGHYEIVNIDATILLELPKIKDLKPSMKKNIAELCKISTQRVNIKATTNEKLGFIGRNEGISAYCVCELIEKIKT